MCGILGIVSNHSVVPRLLTGLSKLEYRGYDSSGLAVLDGQIRCQKSQGKIELLRQLLDKNPIAGNIGISHTRWATHGNPSVINAHPHITEEVAVVHNGIIENAEALKTQLKEQYGITFQTNTDTEIIPKLLTVYLQQHKKPLMAMHQISKDLKGSFTFVALFKNDNSLVAIRKGSPLLLGRNDNGDVIVASDPYVLSLFAENIIYLDNYHYAHIHYDKYTVYDSNLMEITLPTIRVNYDDMHSDKGSFPNFMLKEIFEQPQAIAKTVRRYLNDDRDLIEIAQRIKKGVTIVACGSSYFAALIAKYWLSSISNIAVNLEIASEFTYQNLDNTSQPVLFISQSGETADILMAVEHANAYNLYTIGLTNAQDSSLTRLTNAILYTTAGIEIGVASTKTFATQLIMLQRISLAVAKINQLHVQQNYLQQVQHLSDHIQIFLDNHSDLEKAAELLMQAKNIIYIGRGTSYGVAMEGALKLKELSYLPVEGIAAGELKHGPIALIDENVVTVAVVPYDALFFKTLSNIQEIIARGGLVIAISDAQGAKLLIGICHLTITIPTIDELFSPILYAIPMQLLAYYTALKKGHNVDQPRNLAKSVTVE